MRGGSTTLSHFVCTRERKDQGLGDTSENINIEKLIRKIMWGKSIVTIDGNTYILRQLSVKEQNYIDYLYDKELEESAKLDLITEAELKQIFHNDASWTHDDEVAIQTFKKEIQKCEIEKAGIRKSAKTMIYLKKLNKKIGKITEQLNKLLNTRFSLFKDSAESRAEELSRKLTAFYCLQDIDENQNWKTIEQFNDCTDLLFVNNIIMKYFSTCFLDITTIRLIARNPVWRYKWDMCKNNVRDLFGCSMYDLSYDQNNLVYWSQVYDSVYGAYERPPRSVINNDAALDGWLEDQGKKSESNSVASHYGATKGVPHGKVGKQELFVVAQDTEEAEEIQDLNDMTTRIRMKSEEKKIKNSDEVMSEAKLRKGDLAMQARQQYANKNK